MFFDYNDVDFNALLTLFKYYMIFENDIELE